MKQDEAQERIAELEARVAELEEHAHMRGAIRASIDISPVGLLRVGADGEIVWYSEATAQLLDIEPEVWTGRPFEELVRGPVLAKLCCAVHGDDAPLGEAIMELQRRADPSQPLELRVRGQERWLRYWSQPLRHGDFDGGTLAHFLDVTAQQRSLLDHQKSEARLHSLVESLPFEVWMCDRQGRYLVQNREAIGVWGDVRGQLFEDIEGIEPEMRERWSQVGQRALGGEVVRSELEIERQGRRVHLDEIVAPVRSGSGEIIGVVGFHMDLSPLRAAQQRLQAQRVQTGQMETAARMADSIGREVGQTLESIYEWSELALQKTDSPEQKKYLRAVLDELARASRVTQQLHRVSRLDHDEQARELVDLGEALGQLVPPLRHELPEGFDLRARAEGLSWPVHLERAQLEVLLEHLVDNAREALEAQGGGGTISAIVRRLTPRSGYFREHPWIGPGEWMLLRVLDDGEGMTPRVRSCVFEPYFTTRQGHQGLGLAVVYNIVQHHGGHISIDSRPGGPTQVDVLFPARSS